MNKTDFETLLLAAYQGPGSAEAGTFAGDVLRSCADGCARLWSMEIDGLERRAFVSTAGGDWLTAVCADRGVARREGEDDESLRARTLEKLASVPASGSEDDYRAWCLGAEGILRVRVLPLARGRGTVDIIAVGPDGRAPSPEALAEAQAAVDRERPVGADARVLGAEETPLDISAAVVLMDGADLDAVRAAFAAALAGFCRDTALLSPAASYARLNSLLLDCPGVADVTDFRLCGEARSVPLPPRSAPACGTLELREAAV